MRCPSSGYRRVPGPSYLRRVLLLSRGLSRNVPRIEASFCYVGNGLCFNRLAFFRRTKLKTFQPIR